MKIPGFILVILVAAMAVSAQKNVPLPENATIEQAGKWLTENFAKYASFKTPGREFEVSKPKFAACKLSYTTITRFGSSNHDTMGVTVRRTNAKREAVLDLTVLNPAGITIADHLYPDLKYLRLARSSSTVNPIELSVKNEAADAMSFALSRAIALCKTNAN